MPRSSCQPTTRRRVAGELDQLTQARASKAAGQRTRQSVTPPVCSDLCLSVHARSGLSFEVHSTSSFTPCGFGKHSRVARDHFHPMLPGSPPVGRSETRLFPSISRLFRSLRHALLSRSFGAVLTVAMMSALAVSVVAAGTQVSRPRPRPRGGCRAGSVGRDEQRRQGPRVIGVGGGAAQLRCCAAATMRSGGSG